MREYRFLQPRLEGESHRWALGITAGRLQLCVAAAALLGTTMVCSQVYPTKPVRIVTTGVGGPSDLISRVVAQGISAPLGQPVVVENRAANVLAESTTKAPPDGHTLMVTTGSLWIAPLLQNVSYDPFRDFSPISMLTTQPAILVTHPQLPVKNVRELIALAKARPGELNYAAAGIGGTSHLAAEVFKAMAGVNIVGIFYSSNANQLNALISGEVQVNFSNASTGSPHVKSGRLRALAVTSSAPTLLVPGVPTVAATGLPGFESASVNALFAPQRTPEPVLRRLHDEVSRVLIAQDVKEKFFNAGAEVVAGNAEHLAGVMKSESARLGKVIRDAGIKLNP